MGALAGVDLTELLGESAKHYEADMAITLEEKGLDLDIREHIRDRGADHNEASLRFPSLFFLLHFLCSLIMSRPPAMIVQGIIIHIILLPSLLCSLIHAKF